MKRRTWAARRLAVMLSCAAMAFGLGGPVMAASMPVVEDAAPVYACGLEEHAHGAACLSADLLRDALAVNGLGRFDGRIYAVHQHGGACYGEDGVLTCPLSDPGYMANYENVFVIHHHEDGCAGAGCVIIDNRYEIVDGTGKAVSRHEAADAADVDDNVYVNGVPGGVKDTGDTAPDSGPVYKVGYHVHDEACGGAEGGCTRPVVVELPCDWAKRITCGIREHAHDDGCLAKDDSAPSDFTYTVEYYAYVPTLSMDSLSSGSRYEQGFAPISVIDTSEGAGLPTNRAALTGALQYKNLLLRNTTDWGDLEQADSYGDGPDRSLVPDGTGAKVYRSGRGALGRAQFNSSTLPMGTGGNDDLRYGSVLRPVVLQDFRQIYDSEAFSYQAAPSVWDLDKVTHDNGRSSNYVLSEIWVRGSDSEAWTVYRCNGVSVFDSDNTTSVVEQEHGNVDRVVTVNGLSQVNFLSDGEDEKLRRSDADNNAGTANKENWRHYILLDGSSQVRMVYMSKSYDNPENPDGFKDVSASFVDFEPGRSVSGTGFGIGGDAYGFLDSDGISVNLNGVNIFGGMRLPATFGIVNREGLYQDAGTPLFAYHNSSSNLGIPNDGLVLFDNHDAIDGNLRFKRVGDTYTLYSAEVNPGPDVYQDSFRIGNLDQFTYLVDGYRGDPIYSNSFFPLDSYHGEHGLYGTYDRMYSMDSNVFSGISNDPSSIGDKLSERVRCGELSEDEAQYVLDSIASTQSWGVSTIPSADAARLGRVRDWWVGALSDDARLHNMYFSMKFAMDFTVSPDYCGPLDYLFFGDDDLWVYLTPVENGVPDFDRSKLVCDLGGIHSATGEYVDLWDYVDLSGSANKTYRLSVFYIERGGSGSTCYTRFTLPNATSVADAGAPVDPPEVIGGDELPKTGGAGTGMFLVCGITCVAAAAGIGIRGRRRRG